MGLHGCVCLGRQGVKLSNRRWCSHSRGERERERERETLRERTKVKKGRMLAVVREGTDYTLEPMGRHHKVQHLWIDPRAHQAQVASAPM